MAFDADRVGDQMGLRTTRRGESLGERALGSRQIVVADADAVLATLDGQVAPERGVTAEHHRHGADRAGRRACR